MPDTLADFPFVVVRLGCRKCFRKGHYRLARLAERYGSQIRLGELLTFLAGGCDLLDKNMPWKNACGAYYIDLEPPPRPPDLPAVMMKPKLIMGGKG